MRSCLAFIVCSATIFSSQAFSADLTEWDSGPLFPNCDKTPEGDQENPGYKRYKPLTKVVPAVPKAAVRRGIEAVVLVEFIVNLDGSVTDATVVASGFTDGSQKLQEAFHRSSLKAVSKFRYEPATQDGKPISTEGVRNLITFGYSGDEERLKLGAQYTRASRKVRSWLKSKQPGKALEFLVEVIESDDHSGIVLAAYLYLNGLTQMQLRDTNGAIESLVASKSLYESIQFNPNALKLQTYAGMVLATLYAQKNQWQESTNEFKSALFVHRRARMPLSQRVVYGYANLGVGATRLRDWCIAAESFGRAIESGEKLNSNIPENWRTAHVYAQQQISGTDSR